MYIISSYQLKAARAMLDWSRKDTAAATGLDPNTIRNIENGFISPRATTNNVLHIVFGKAGLEFTEDDGVKRRKHQISIHGCDSFFDDVLETIKTEGGSVAVSIKTQDALSCLFGVSNTYVFERFKSLNSVADVRCLISSPPQPSFKMPQFQIRMADQKNIRVPCFVYGNKHATMISDHISAHFAAFTLPDAARSYHNDFLELWNDSKKI